jgi:hypothetical protein
MAPAGNWPLQGACQTKRDVNIYNLILLKSFTKALMKTECPNVESPLKKECEENVSFSKFKIKFIKMVFIPDAERMETHSEIECTH